MKLNIGIVGLGTVGSGLIELIEKNKNQIKKIYNILYFKTIFFTFSPSVTLFYNTLDKP